MRKFLFNCILIAILLLAKHEAFANYLQPWKIDAPMKFSITYLHDSSSLLSLKNSQKICPIFEPSYVPDVTNLKLSTLLAMGFDLPVQNAPENYNLFLKLYKFPQKFSHLSTTNDFLKFFGLNFSTFNPEIQKFLSLNKNLIIKMGYIAENNTKFTKTNAFPPFMVSNNKDFIDYFPNQIPFYSIYLAPTVKPSEGLSEDELAKYSSNGVAGFNKELIAYYKRNFCELDGEDKSYNYFWVTVTQKKKYILIKVPKEPLFFENWRELQMPQDPKHTFLTSLLLVSGTEYISNKNAPAITPAVDSKEFNESYEKGKTKIFEIGSVFHTK